MVDVRLASGDPLAVVRQIPPPPAIRTLSTLPELDYADTFLADVSRSTETWTAERWARTTLEDAPGPVRRQLRLGWRSLGLRLGPAEAGGTILGWEMLTRTPRLVLLGARSRTGMPAELLFKRQPDALLFATFIRFQNPVVRAVWVPVVAPHQRIVRYLLTRAARSG